ncbi:hypothetical protein FGB62_160g012 [Gracilaria domingensis]|nr:hypothetical protein FGB62_160g012 [Gracilaria domingensis]
MALSLHDLERGIGLDLLRRPIITAFLNACLLRFFTDVFLYPDDDDDGDDDDDDDDCDDDDDSGDGDGDDNYMKRQWQHNGAAGAAVAAGGHDGDAGVDADGATVRRAQAAARVRV